MPRHFITLSYKGTRYAGWQRQPNAQRGQATIQAIVEFALSTLCRLPESEIALVGSGRTDAGVHALAQIAHAELPFKIPPADFLRRLNAILPQDICCLNICPVAPDAHARFSATARAYIYLACVGKPVFAQEVCTRLPTMPDIDAMNAAAQALIGDHNFRGFAKQSPDEAHYLCRISSLTWHLLPSTLGPFQSLPLLALRIEANRFLRGQVRAIVGALLQVGNGKRSISWVADVLAAQSTQLAAGLAPPQGLYLEQVSYPNTIYLP